MPLQDVKLTAIALVFVAATVSAPGARHNRIFGRIKAPVVGHPGLNLINALLGESTFVLLD